MQRRVAVRQVAGHDAPVRLGVDRTARRHEGRDVGDGVVDPIAARVPLQGDGLVEIARSRRIEGEELDVAPVLVGKARAAGRRLGLFDDRRGELGGDVVLGADGGEAGREVRRDRWSGTEAAQDRKRSGAPRWPRDAVRRHCEDLDADTA
jgi:hypothetical protein